MNIAAALVTVPRAEGYLYRTIESLEGSGFWARAKEPLRLVAGSPDVSHLDPYHNQPERFIIDELPEEEAAKVRFPQLGQKPRCAFGHCRKTLGVRHGNGIV